MTIDVDPVIGRLGAFEFGWYGVIMAAGILLGLWIVARQLKARGIDSYHVLGIAIFALPFGIIGARLVHVLENLSYFVHHPGEIFGLGMVGLAIYGVIAGSLLGAVLYCLLRKLPVLRVLDCGALAFPVAQLVGKCANIINGDTWGSPTDLPWGITYVNPRSYIPDSLLGVATHPTPIYEQIWLVVVILVLALNMRRLMKVDGLAILVYFWLYSLGRFVISFYRVNTEILWGLKEAQVIALVVLIAVPPAAYWLIRRAKRRQTESSIEKPGEGKTP
jgi:phosphatidylglycerol:prolipoprotein diacylglycerol transferase